MIQGHREGLGVDDIDLSPPVEGGLNWQRGDYVLLPRHSTAQQDRPDLVKKRPVGRLREREREREREAS
jgi:hypothetical protein